MEKSQEKAQKKAVTQMSIVQLTKSFHNYRHSILSMDREEIDEVL